MPDGAPCLRLMGHELRTPLNAIIGFSDILAQGLAGPVTSEQERQLRMVGDAGRQLLLLIDDMMELAKAQAGALNLANEPVDPSWVLSECVERTLRLAESRGARVKLVSPADPITFVADPLRTRQAFENMVVAALRLVADCTLSLTAEVNQDGTTVEFCINGLSAGAEAQAVTRVFDVDDADVRANPGPSDGVELGLCLSRAYARAMGGTISSRRSPAGSSDVAVLSLPLTPNGI